MIRIDEGVMSSSLPPRLSGKSSGKVHSCFKHSLNISLADSLINLNAAPKQLSSFGMQVSGSVLQSLLHALKPGDLVYCESKQLDFYPSYEAVIRADTSAFKVEDLHVKAFKPNQRQMRMLAELFFMIDFSGKTGIDQTPRTLSVLTALTEGKIFEEDLRYLVGRGKGLTPSGDDILTGFYFMQLLLDPAKKIPAYLCELEFKSSTVISATYLSYLAEGFASSYLIQFAQALREECFSQLTAAVNLIKSFGSTSGYDTLLGMKIGFKRLWEIQNHFIISQPKVIHPFLEA